MSRILSRRSDSAPASAVAPTDAPSAEAPDAALPADGEQPTAVLPAVATEEPAATDETAPAAEEATATEPAAEVPAGADSVPPAAPTFLTRGKLRRRLRYLRRVREIGFRDLGGLVFDLDRFGRERPDLVELKLAGLKSIDAELRALEVALHDLREDEELFEPGVSACARCGALHGSEARFCPSCATPVDAPPANAGEPPSAAPDESAADADQPTA